MGFAPAKRAQSGSETTLKVNKPCAADDASDGQYSILKHREHQTNDDHAKQLDSAMQLVF